MAWESITRKYQNSPFFPKQRHQDLSGSESQASGFLELTSFPGGSEDKASACNAGDQGSIPGLGRSPGEGNGNPLQYSCLDNPMDGGAWWATVDGVAQSQTRLSSLSLFTFMHWRRKWQPTPVFLPGESQGQRSLVDCRLWGRTELDTTEVT